MPTIADQKGFTLIELLVAMAVFAFMLTIVIVGFINVVNIHNAALASNKAQDSARSAMETLVSAVRDSGGAQSLAPQINPIAGGVPGLGGSDFDVMCLETPTGFQDFYVTGSPAQIMRGDVSDCADPTPTNTMPLTSTEEMVTYFKTTQMTSGPSITKPEIQLQMTLGSSNGTAGGTGQSLQCNNNNADRVFCSTATLTSGAVPR